MNLSRPFILRPVATGLLMLALLLSGVMAWRLLPVAALPQVDYPIIQVFTFYPGASPDLTASAITAPLERRFGQIPGLNQMSSSSSLGASVITLQFALTLDMGVAEQEVQAAIMAATNLLPNNLPAPPIYRKVNPADVPIVTLAATSDTLALPDIYDLIDTRLAQRLAQLPGVGMVSLAGGQRPAVRVQADPNALAANGLDLEAVRQAIAAANVNQPKGSFDGPVRTVLMDANDQLRTVQEYRDLVLAWPNGAPLRLGDVALIEQGPEDRRLAAWVNGKPAVLINIQRQPGANVIDVADSIRALLPQLTASLPAALKVDVFSDRTESIRASVLGVQIELIFAVALVVLVTFLFLREFRATLIPGIVVPLSLIGTFGVMYLAGFSVNNLTLMALTIAAGFVVDDAIVMLENIARHREQGMGRMEAALLGARQIGFTLVSLTVSLIAVLIPLLFMGDVVGRLFREFAITLAVAILISLVVSLTLTPMMCARMLPPPRHDQNKRAGLFDRMLAHYATSLDWVLARQRTTLLVAASTLALTAVLYMLVPKGFFPVQDSGMLQGVTEAPQTVSFSAMADRQQAMAQALSADPDVAGVASFIGVDGSNATPNTGRLLIDLVPLSERTTSPAEIAARLAGRAAEVRGIKLYLQPVQELSIEDRVARTQYQFTLTSPDGDQLDAWATRFAEALSQRPELADVASDRQNAGLRVWLDVDREAAARLGVTMTNLTSVLHDAYGQRQIATLFTQANQYRVVLEAEPRLAQDPADLLRLHVRATNGGLVPVGAVAKIRHDRAALLVSRVGQFPAITMSFNAAPGVSLGEAVAAIEAERAALNQPAAIEFRLQGAAQAFEASLANTLWLVLAAVVTMYIVLGVLYESTIHPVTILSTLPSAAVGALLALLLSGRPLDMIAVIGIILLIGLVKKNGIMMVDFALEAERTQGMAPDDAIRQAALQRLRPILMTTLAALVGALPLMFASGSGAELRQPLGLVMVGGLVVSQILTLYTTPVIYLWFDRLGRLRRNRATTAPASGTAG